ncbi:MAG: type II toxin-antitoxin system VapC family toxin [Oculatellaceae cyanobacterium Prado106]|nr:type II toxin-antitoxin system VapC family toxin [Oculatellaceae cyanobacterium Prado106]
MAISWCLPDEQDAYLRLLAALRAKRHEAIAPDIWWMELVNVLWVAERRGRMTATQTDAALLFLRSLAVTIYPTTDEPCLDATLALSRQYNLAAYDAAYLELAVREQVLLATIDTRLRNGARSLNILLEDISPES